MRNKESIGITTKAKLISFEWEFLTFFNFLEWSNLIIITIEQVIIIINGMIKNNIASQMLKKDNELLCSLIELISEQFNFRLLSLLAYKIAGILAIIIKKWK